MPETTASSWNAGQRGGGIGSLKTSSSGRAGKTRAGHTGGKERHLKEQGGITLDEYKNKHGYGTSPLSVIIKPSAEKPLDRLPANIRRRVAMALWKT